MSPLDLIAIGDCTIDAFIKLHDASVHCDINHKRCQLCMSFADKIPYEDLDIVSAVGNSSNVAVGISRLGLKSAIITAIGGDQFGKQILDVYRKEKVSAKFVKVNKSLPTNYHFVLSYQAERTILIKHHRYSYFPPERIGTTPWVYFSSMADHTLPFHKQLAAYLGRHPDIRMGFNPGTFQLKLGKEKLKAVYKASHVLFVNKEEAQKILRKNTSDVKVLMRGLHALGPKIVLVTDGPSGSYASDGTSLYFMPAYPDPKPPFERTGAGDAFSAGFMAALVYKKPLDTALRWAPISSMSVVQYTGAQRGLLTLSQMKSYLKKAPKKYAPKTI